MNSVERLHAAARRYLEITWFEATKDKDWRKATRDELQAASSREYARAALEWLVLRTKPRKFSSLEEARHYFVSRSGAAFDDCIEGGLRALNRKSQDATRARLDDVDRTIVAEEAGRFCQYLSDLDADTLRTMETLPYRRILSPVERRRHCTAMRRRWDIRTSGWYPMDRGDDDRPANALAFQSDYFDREVARSDFQALFRARGVTRIWQFSESDYIGEGLMIGLPEPALEVEPAVFVPRFPLERFWTSRELDWLVYVSHERSITIAGDWLVSGVKAIWPNWEERRYTGWDYPRPDDHVGAS